MEMTHQETRKFLLDHTISPIYKRKKGKFDFSVKAVSKTCSDQITIYTWNDRIYFDGHSCSISTASLDILLMEIENLSIEKKINFISYYIKFLNGGPSQKLGKLNIFKSIRKFPNRVNCALLGPLSLRKLLTKSV